jgi:hypothetical protein
VVSHGQRGQGAGRLVAEVPHSVLVAACRQGRIAANGKSRQRSSALTTAQPQPARSRS